MSGAYWVAWITLYITGIALITLCVYPLRKRFYLAFFVGAIGVFWMLVPIPFNEEHWAPLFVVLTFQLFLDAEASFALSATAATLGTLAIVAATLILYGFNTAFRRVTALTQRRDREVDATQPNEPD